MHVCMHACRYRKEEGRTIMNNDQENSTSLGFVKHTRGMVYPNFPNESDLKLDSAMHSNQMYVAAESYSKVSLVNKYSSLSPQN